MDVISSSGRRRAGRAPAGSRSLRRARRHGGGPAFRSASAGQRQRHRRRGTGGGGGTLNGLLRGEGAGEDGGSEEGGWWVDEAGDAEEGGAEPGVVFGAGLDALQVAAEESGAGGAWAVDVGEGEVGAEGHGPGEAADPAGVS